MQGLCMSIERLRRSSFHIWRTVPTKSLLIADSQARHIDAGNLNILSLPGAGIKHVYDFLPPNDRLSSSSSSSEVTTDTTAFNHPPSRLQSSERYH